MGILFNVLVIGPLRRGFDGLDARWRVRKDAGSDVFPLKPSDAFALGGAAFLVFLVVGGLVS